MIIIKIFFTIGWLALSVFLTQLCLRWFLGPLYDAAKNSRKPTQYSIGDIYLLIGQIAFATLPAALVPMSESERVQTFIFVALFLGLSWFLCCRMLARNRIKRAKIRMIAMLLFHLQLGVALIAGFGALALLGLFILAFPMALGVLVTLGVFFLISLHISNWLYEQREGDPPFSVFVGGAERSGAAISENPLPEDVERKGAVPPEVRL